MNDARGVGPGRRRAARLVSVGLPLLLAACTLPGRTYPVSPVLSGQLQGEVAFADAEVVLRVQHHENPTLAAEHRVALAADGRFRFEPIELAVAGHEYTKRYRAFLRFRGGPIDRPIWRAEYERGEIGTPVQLDCRLDRPIEHGQPCRVVDARRYPWIVRAGEAAFMQRCASCHGVAGLGDGPVASVLFEQPPDLRRIALRRGGHFDRDAVAERIEGRSLPAAHGTSEMPVWGERLTAEYEHYVGRDEMIAATLDSIVAYLETVQATR
jgi:mono/diheme cytochrome c family protein